MKELYEKVYHTGEDYEIEGYMMVGTEACEFLKKLQRNISGLTVVQINIYVTSIKRQKGRILIWNIR